LDLTALTSEELRAILDEARARKRRRADLPKGAPDAEPALAGRVLAMIFQKNSTRTRVSFEMAMRQLGGAAIVLSAADTQLGRGESMEDTARALSRMVDAVAIRANAHEDVVAYADASSVPVINGLTNRSHPCQVMADLMTIEERLGAIEGRTVAWVGDGNNVCASFVHAAQRFAFKLKIASPPAHALPTFAAAGADIEHGADPVQAVADADIVVTDTWVSMGDADKDARMAAFPPYQVNDALMAYAAPHAIFLHCLPAHRGEEVTDSVIDGPRSAVWDAAENRIHAQKAVLLWCLGKL
jgi:ornithine carbamoyltransferase